MQFLFELAPVIAFFVAYKIGGIYVATTTIMVAMAIMLAVDYLRTRRIEGPAYIDSLEREKEQPMLVLPAT